MSERPASEPRDRGLLLFLLALVLGAVRFWKLGEWSLWIDEALPVADYTNRPASAGNPVGYLLIRATVEALGGRPDEYALRFLPALDISDAEIDESMDAVADAVREVAT